MVGCHSRPPGNPYPRAKPIRQNVPQYRTGGVGYGHSRSKYLSVLRREETDRRRVQVVSDTQNTARG